MPPAAEIRGWARLISGVADEAVVGTVHDMHRAINRGVFRWLGPIGRPVAQVVDAVTDHAYAGVRLGIRGAGELGAAAAGYLGTDRTTPRSAKARAVAHGVVDGRYLSHAPELDVDLGLRVDGRDVAPQTASLAAAYPEARGRIAVFLHGLIDSEEVWTAEAPGHPSLPDVVAAHGMTPVLVRYGTGRTIARNGEDLDALLAELVAAWPVPVTGLTLIGHSMGGLVARGACLHAAARGQRWLAPLTDVVYLGSPHHGSWLEKVANVGSWVLRHSSSHSAPIGELLDGRSRGIKDLRFGTFVDDGATAEDARPIDGLLTGRSPDRPWLPEVAHHLVVGRLRPDPRHPLNAVFGDGLVRRGSAGGSRRRPRLGADEANVVPVAARHTHLTHHPEVVSALRGVLDGA